MRPIQVYFDSSDFSRFGEVIGGRGKPGDEQLMIELEKLSASGDVEYRYSYIHVVEAAPTTDTALHFAIERADAIMRLCRRRALPPFMYLPIIEAAGSAVEPDILDPRDRLRFNGRSDSGQWFNSFRQVFLDSTASLREMYNDPIKAVAENDPDFPMNRAMRRKVKKKSSPKLMSQQFAREIPTMWPAFMERVQAEFPFSNETSELWQKHLLGKCSTEQVNDSLQRDLSNLPNLMHWLKPSGGTRLRELPGWLRESAGKYKLVVATAWAMRDDGIKNSTTILGKDEVQAIWNDSRSRRRESFQNRIREGVRKTILEEGDYIQELGVNMEALTAVVDEKWIEAFPSQRVLVEAYMGNFEKNISPFEQQRKIEKVGSDVGDIMHALYMPYVDILRVDGFANQYLKTASSLMNTELVDKLEKLAPAIRKRLSTRNP